MSFRKAVALLLILAMLGAGGYYLLKTEREDDNRMRSLYTEVEPLERERESLQQEKKNLETDYALKMRDYGTVEILFLELDSQIITEVWPLMRERGIVGTLGMNFKETPINYNKLSADDVNRLVADGWGTCVIVDSALGTDFTYWFDQFRRYQESYKLPVPTTIYFTNGLYDSAMDQELIDCGFTTVILDSTSGRNTVTDLSGDLWFTGAMPWGYTGSATDLELLGRTDGANLVLTMKLKEIWDKSLNRNVESQEKLAFIDILDSWKELLYEDDPLQDLEKVGPTPNIYINTNDSEALHEMYLNSLTPEQQLLLPKFRSVNAETALRLHRDAIDSNSTLVQERDAKEADLDRQIAVLDEKIRNTYAAYGVGNNDANPEQKS